MGEKLELRLESLVGAEPAVYPWPLPVYVSATRPLLPDPRLSSPTARAEPTEKRSDSSRQTFFGAPLPAPPWFSAAVSSPRAQGGQRGAGAGRGRRLGRGDPALLRGARAGLRLALQGWGPRSPRAWTAGGLALLYFRI